MPEGFDSQKAWKLHQELLSMPELKLREQLDSILLPIYIFDKNYAELKALFEFFINDPKSIPLTFQRNRDKFHLFQQELIRLLHNFVSASLTLIDHTRKLFRDLNLDSDLFPDYQIKIRDEFINDPLSQFVKCLRNYFQHYSSPNIQINESIILNDEDNQGIVRTVTLLPDDLIKWDGWTAPAKNFLRKPNKNINLLEVSDAYRTKVISFYQWFINRQNEIHQNEIFLVDQKRVEYLQAEIFSLISMRLTDKSPKVSIEEDVFSGIIKSDELMSLESFQAPPNIKADYAIQLLLKHVPIPENLVEMIYKLYRHNQ